MLQLINPPGLVEDAAERPPDGGFGSEGKGEVNSNSRKHTISMFVIRMCIIIICSSRSSSSSSSSSSICIIIIITIRGGRRDRDNKSENKHTRPRITTYKTIYANNHIHISIQFHIRHIGDCLYLCVTTYDNT